MRKGQMLLEVVLALAIVTIVMVALVQLSTRSIKNSDFSRSQAEATSYASEGMEWIRSQRTSLDWSGATGFFAKSGSTYCLSSLGWGVTGACSANNIISGSRSGVSYWREATLATIQATIPQRVQVAVTVKWDQGGVSHSAKQDAVFTQY